MRKTLFMHYMILVIVGVFITGFFTSQLTQKFYTVEVEEKLKNTALLIQANIAEETKNGIKADYDNTAKKYAQIMSQSLNSGSRTENNSIRVTIIDKNGVVLGDSEENIKSMENHLDRKEVQEAIDGKFGKDIRFSHTQSVDRLYVAVPTNLDSLVIRVSVPLIQLKNIQDIMWLYTVIVIAAGILLTSLLAYRLSSSIVNPINELIRVSREISVGNYSKRATVRAKDELGQLARTFNDMAVRLEKTMAEILDKNIKVESIIDSMPSGIVAVDHMSRIILINSIACETFGIKNGPGILGINVLELIRHSQINSYLKESMEKNASMINEISIGSPQERILRIYTNPIKSKDIDIPNSGGLLFIQDITTIRKLEQIRTEFVSNVTHELKTPLTSIRGFIETLRNGAIDDREVSERFLEIIDIEAERLYILINDILQLSEIETNQKDVNIGTYKLKNIAEETLSILHGTAEKKNVTLSVKMEENLSITANRNRIKQMLINLVENGIKYNKDGGCVDISAHKAEGRIVISVRDSGIGISSQHLPRIFERFYRVDKGRSRSMGGTGLGLSIVKHIVNLYSGDIKVVSESGEGTEFIISLPA